jgi:hypothetical protein
MAGVKERVGYIRESLAMGERLVCGARVWCIGESLLFKR